MPARGQRTGRLYQKEEIFIDSAYAAMMVESLYLEDEPDVLVTPIRRQGSPHWRRENTALYRIAVERRESDPTHDRCIAELCEALRSKKLSVWSTDFLDSKVQWKAYLLHQEGLGGLYHWWKDDAGCRVPVGQGRFIQPDICGRSASVFFPTGKAKSVVVEVINTHIPERGTFYALLELSQYHHLVLFYYVAPGSSQSQYSRRSISETEVEISVAHYLLDGKVYRNGKEVEQFGKTDDEWYEHLKATYFGTPLRDKRAN